MNVELIKPIGYCYGVINAINFAIKIKHKHQEKNVCVFGLLIHNEEIIKFLESYNIYTINTENINIEEKLETFTSDDVVIFTAHGHKKEYEVILRKNNVLFYDAVCPRVQDNIDTILSYKKDIIYIGKSTHPEAIVCKSLKDIHFYDIDKGFYYPKNLVEPLVLNQTTLSFLEIEKIHQDIIKNYPDATIKNEICDASRIRQENIKKIPDTCDLIMVVGDIRSSNSNKLYEIAKEVHPNKTVLFVENANELTKYNLNKFKNTFITSGTSTPIEIINQIYNYLTNL